MIKFHQIKLLLFLFILIFICSCENSKEGPPPPPAVIVSPVIEEDVARSQVNVAQVVAKEKVALIPRVEGFFVKKCIADGQYVKKGDLLYQIEKDQYLAELEAAIADVDNKKAVLTEADIEYNRNRYLSDRDAVAKHDFDVATANKATAVADLLGAKAKLKQAKLNLSYTEIYAPFNGQLGVCNYSVGDLVGPGSDSDSAFNTIVMLDPIRVEFYLAEPVFVEMMQSKYFSFTKSKVKGGPDILQHIVVQLKLSDGSMYPYKGYVNFIDNKVDPTTGTVMMRALFKNPKFLLRPGAYVTALLSSDRKIKTLLIPQAAVLEDQGGEYVLVVDKDRKVKSQKVELGELFGEFIEVRGGLKKGEYVIKAGIQKVREGMVVSVTVSKETYTGTIVTSSNVGIKNENNSKGNSTQKSNENISKKIYTDTNTKDTSAENFRQKVNTEVKTNSDTAVNRVKNQIK